MRVVSHAQSLHGTNEPLTLTGPLRRVTQRANIPDVLPTGHIMSSMSAAYAGEHIRTDTMSAICDPQALFVSTTVTHMS
jgi:hypothetical protein